MEENVSSFVKLSEQNLCSAQEGSELQMEFSTVPQPIKYVSAWS